jgi:maleamate amidohydrolase
MDAVDDYAAAGLGGSIDLGRPQPTALVVVDPVRTYVEPDCPLYAGGEAAAATMVELLADARAAGLPVFITRIGHHPSGVDSAVYGRKVPAMRWFADDSPYARYIEGLEPTADDVEVVKQYPSAFTNTTLASTLTFLGIRRLLIAGFSTSGCIRVTATDALAQGFEAVVVSDAVGDRQQSIHDANLFDIRAKSGEVVTRSEARTLIGLT